jgi:hypothetical protein
LSRRFFLGRNLIGALARATVLVLIWAVAVPFDGNTFEQFFSRFVVAPLRCSHVGYRSTAQWPLGGASGLHSAKRFAGAFEDEFSAVVRTARHCAQNRYRYLGITLGFGARELKAERRPVEESFCPGGLSLGTIPMPFAASAFLIAFF